MFCGFSILLTDSEIEVIARGGFCIVPLILVVYILLVVYKPKL